MSSARIKTIFGRLVMRSASTELVSQKRLWWMPPPQDSIACHPDEASSRASLVILTKRASRAAGRISDSFAPAKPVPGSEIAQHSWCFRLLAFLETFQVARSAGLTQLAQRFRLDLPDTLAGDGELLADFLERVVGLLPDAEAHAQDLLLARRQRGEHLARLLAEVALDCGLDGRRRDRVLDEIAERTFFFGPNRRFERNRFLDDLEHLLDLVQRHLHLLGDFLGAGFAAEPLHQQARHAKQLVDGLDHVHRDANGAALVGDRARHRLPNPPRRVRRKFVAALIFELVD